MIPNLLLIGLAFLWLMVETDWLRVRLPVGVIITTGDVIIQKLLPIAIATGVAVGSLQKFLTEEEM